MRSIKRSSVLVAFNKIVTTTLILVPFSSFARAFTPRLRSTSSLSLFAVNSKKKKDMSTATSNIAHAPKELIPDWMMPTRTRCLTDPTLQVVQSSGNSVVYWMQRDVRTTDNWALLWSASLARQFAVPLHVMYVLEPPKGVSSDAVSDADQIPDLEHLPFTSRYGKFLLGGLEHVHHELMEKNVPLHVLQPKSHESVGQTVMKAVKKVKPIAVVCDMSPLRTFRQRVDQIIPLLTATQIPCFQVDAHNIVPVWIASGKREYAARTIRTKIHKVLQDYLTDIPELEGNKKGTVKDLPAFEMPKYEAFMHLDSSVPAVDWAVPGTAAGMSQWESFIQEGLPKYDTLRNDPNSVRVCSNLSPWINHGHVSFQRIAYKTKKIQKHATAIASFLEEGIVRRELSDNYCYYAPDNYDSLEAAADWAQETLHTHASDPRDYVYTLEELEQGRTHDDLWNAAQLQVVREGQMHGFMRMYWAKKILEWTESPDVALRTAQYFNDKYALDGRDPNGFVGVGWSIMGIHDQGWAERPVFGKIRYMNYNGCKRKFDVARFVARYKGAAEGAMTFSSKQKRKASEKSGTTTKKPRAKKVPAS